MVCVMEEFENISATTALPSIHVFAEYNSRRQRLQFTIAKGNQFTRIALATSKTRKKRSPPTGVYIDVHELGKTAFDAVLRRTATSPTEAQKNKARYKQVKARRVFVTGVYIDVHEQTKIRRNDELRRRFFVFLGDAFEVGRRMLTPRTNKIIGKRAFVYVTANLAHPFFLRRRGIRITSRITSRITIRTRL